MNVLACCLIFFIFYFFKFYIDTQDKLTVMILFKYLNITVLKAVFHCEQTAGY